MANGPNFGQKLMGQVKDNATLSPQSYSDMAVAAQQSIEGGNSRGSVSHELNAFFSLQTISDPVSLAWRPFFGFSDTCGLLANESHVNSALNYLKRIGETYRYTLLKKFIEQLKMISSRMTYVFQEIEGLETAYKRKPWESSVGDDNARITIKTLETVDFKIQSLMNMYRDIWFDYSRMAEILPANLRRFSLSIFVYAMGIYRIEVDRNVIGDDGNVVTYKDDYVKGAIPNIHNGADISSLSNSYPDTSSLYLKAPDLFNHVVIDLAECEFIPWESGAPFFTNLSNKSVDMMEFNELAISYRFCKDRWRFYGQTGDEAFGSAMLMAAAVEQKDAKKFDLLDKYNNLKDKAFNNPFMQKNPFVQKLAQQVFDKTVGQYEQQATTLMEKFGSLERLEKTGIDFIQGITQNAVDKLSSMLMSKVNKAYLGNVYEWDASSIIGSTFTALGSSNPASHIERFIPNSKIPKDTESISKLPSGANVYNKM